MEWSKLLPYQGEVPWKIFRKMIIWQTVFIHLCVYMRYSQFKPLRRRIHFSFITKYHKNCSQKPPHDFLAYRCWQYVKSIYIYIYICKVLLDLSAQYFGLELVKWFSTGEVLPPRDMLGNSEGGFGVNDWRLGLAFTK